jgi:hypothetical protein
MTESLLPVMLLAASGVLFQQNALGATCDVPSDLQRELSGKHPEAHIVSLADLEAGDKELFLKEHGDVCPGAVAVDFYGDGKSTLAISLLTNERQRQKAFLLVARIKNSRWTLAQLGTAESATPVVWSDAPGEYPNVYRTKKIKAKWPVVVWCAYDAWSTLYSWTGSRVSKIWLSD